MGAGAAGPIRTEHRPSRSSIGLCRVRGRFILAH